MREYKEHFVAFLDILGFKSILGKYECEEIYNIFDVIHKYSEGSLVYNGVRIEAYEHMKHKILSDSIIVYIDASIEDSFAALLYICESLQKSLLLREKPILLRGGIALGNLYDEGDVIYGEGLTKAYLLECNLAKYPRIIFTEETLKAGKRTCNHMFHEFEPYMRVYDCDKDALYFITYRPPIGRIDIKKWKSYTDILLNMCNSVLDTATDASLREKYLWLRDWTNKIINAFSNLKEAYDKEKKEKQEAHKREIDKRCVQHQEND